MRYRNIGVAQVAAASILKGQAMEMGESSRQQPKSKAKAVTFNKSEFPPIMYKGKGKMIAKPHEQQPKNTGGAMVISPYASCSVERVTPVQSKLRADAREFIPLLVNNPVREAPRQRLVRKGCT